MGASGWDYYVPYREDIGAALAGLRQEVFDAQDYYWDPWDEDAPDRSRTRPATIEELWEDEGVQEEGTHSILDMERVLRPGEQPDYGTVEPVRPEEARRLTGTDVLTREHIQAIEPLAARRWFGRVAVLHDSAGLPRELYFWGFSGD
ncbi:hypothetical protein AB0J38_35945 [Streptomyces sp. NPDC050095]|uniref:hypothetical protein n=1 Tax=unclassified Streptomyces TaxID=2593676 RepID=UPI00344889CC